MTTSQSCHLILLCVSQAILTLGRNYKLLLLDAASGSIRWTNNCTANNAFQPVVSLDERLVTYYDCHFMLTVVDLTTGQVRVCHVVVFAPDSHFRILQTVPQKWASAIKQASRVITVPSCLVEPAQGQLLALVDTSSSTGVYPNLVNYYKSQLFAINFNALNGPPTLAWNVTISSCNQGLLLASSSTATIIICYSKTYQGTPTNLQLLFVIAVNATGQIMWR